MRRTQPEARAEFFRRYAPQVRRILFLQGLCDEVDDAVQEVFIKVYRADLPAEERFLAWFYRLILNTGRDQGRRRKTRRGLAERLEELASSHGTHTDVTVPGDPALRTALEGLSPDFREAVALRFFADLSLESIAAAQDVPLGTVKSRLHGALARMRQALAESGYEHET
jgi:RNA polymerase sigma-70 factor (ECF subfamily)